MQPSAELTVVIADDDTLVREAFAALWTKIGMNVVGQAADGQAAVELVLELKPDFAILDLGMPRLTGTQAVRKLREAACKTKLFILTLTNQGPAVREAISAGADAYLLKSGTLHQLEDAVKEALEGSIYIAPELRKAAVLTDAPSSRAPDPLKALTKRERQVFPQLAKGRMVGDIADTLEVSAKTIESHRSAIMKKLGLESITALVLFAIRHKLIDPDDPDLKNPWVN